MAELKQQPIPEKAGGKKTEENIVELIKKRRSQELLIGICGAIGSGTKELGSTLQTILAEHNYEVELIKISTIIYDIKADPSLSGLSGYKKYKFYQEAGNEIRQKMGTTKLAAEAIADIIRKREKYLPKKLDAAEEIRLDDLKNTKRVAYIIDQLKHPDEVTLLRTVYKQNFYLVGVISTEKERKNNLEQQPMLPKEADDLVHRDRSDKSNYGQQVEKTFHLSDYFIRNKHNNASQLNNAVERFVKLVHGYNGVTPTNDEVGMFEAYSASLKSACLSRQVGAAIMNDKGDILSSGCNDVPVFGGGLYTAEHGDGDHRCIFKGEKCFNDLHKKILQEQFEKILDEEFTKILNEDFSKKLEADGVKNPNAIVSEVLKAKGNLAEKLLKESKAKDLIEYSRAIHAEMDALIQLARTEGETTLGATLYTTTYPCHNCARHIVAAGIHKVIYIEPYEKSLALQLHDDSISDTAEENKVSFEPFDGASPRRYSKFFEASGRKDKNTGKAIKIKPADAYHIDPQFLDSYIEYENKVAERSKEQPNPFKAAS